MLDIAKSQPICGLRALPLALMLLGVGAQCKSARPDAQPMRVPQSETSTDEAVTEFPMENGFSRLACSPTSIPPNAPGLFFRSRDEVVWGDAIPICGFLRVPAEMPRPSTSSSFQVEVRLGTGEEFHHDSTNVALGHPPLGESDVLYQRLESEGETFFHASLRSAYTTLEPGEYTIALRFHKLESERRRLVVSAGGWRGEMTSFLSNAFCEGTLMSDFEAYLKIQDFLNTSDIGDENTLAALMADRAEAGRKAFGKYADEIAEAWRTGMAQESNVDLVVPTYAAKQIQERCATKPGAENLVYVYEALRRFAVE